MSTGKKVAYITHVKGHGGDKPPMPGIHHVKKPVDHYQAFVLTQAYDEYLFISFASIKESNDIIFDTKSIVVKNLLDARL